MEEAIKKEKEEEEKNKRRDKFCNCGIAFTDLCSCAEPDIILRRHCVKCQGLACRCIEIVKQTAAISKTAKKNIAKSAHA
jgi:hypothetical protein